MIYDWLRRPENDTIAARAIGMVLTGAFLLLCVGLRLTPKQIGA